MCVARSKRREFRKGKNNIDLESVKSRSSTKGFRVQGIRIQGSFFKIIESENHSMGHQSTQ